jgi:hypothetical protein
MLLQHARRRMISVPTLSIIETRREHSEFAEIATFVSHKELIGFTGGVRLLAALVFPRRPIRRNR